MRSAKHAEADRRALRLADLNFLLPFPQQVPGGDFVLQ
jgi:hypothetical protein